MSNFLGLKNNDRKRGHRDAEKTLGKAINSNKTTEEVYSYTLFNKFAKNKNKITDNIKSDNGNEILRKNMYSKLSTVATDDKDKCDDTDHADGRCAIVPHKQKPFISESNIYYVYSEMLVKDQYRIVMKDSMNIDRNLNTGERVLIPQGTKMRLHYPMERVNNITYMTGAFVDGETGDFTLNHVPIYGIDHENSNVIRYISNFTV